MKALVTGASSGIGTAYAKVFAMHGYDVILVGRNETSLFQVANELQAYDGYVRVIQKDLSVRDEVHQLYEETRTECIDVLVNNAGFGQYGFFHETPLEAELGMIDVNISAVTILTKLFLQEMVRKDSGTIINVASTAAFQPVPLMNVYGASKAYVLSLTESIASELEGSNIHVMAVCPGSTESDFHRRAGSERRPDDKTKLMTAEKVADVTYQAMLAKQRIVVPGTGNQLISQAHRFLPRALLARLAKQMYMKRQH